MKRYLLSLLASMLLSGITAAAQSVPEIRFDSEPSLLKFPDNIHLGEAAGVATDSKGNIFVYTRTGHPTITIGTSRAFAHGGSRLFEWLFSQSPAWNRNCFFAGRADISIAG